MLQNFEYLLSYISGILVKSVYCCSYYRISKNICIDKINFYKHLGLSHLSSRIHVNKFVSEIKSTKTEWSQIA
jgi:hypothetical protein